MSLDTLLEAAQFLEWSNPAAPKARGGEVTEFHHYAKAGPESGGRKNSGCSDKSVDSVGSDGELRRRPGGAGTREVHNKLEKNRRAHLKECFENLKQQVPNMEDKKTSNLSILRGALRYIQLLKRREKELEQEMQKLAQEKILSQEKLGVLKTDLAALPVDIGIILANCVKQEDAHSDSTATADNEPILSDDEDGQKKPLMVAMVTNQSSMPPPSMAVKTPLTGTVTFAVPKVPPNSLQSRQAKQLTLNSLVQKTLNTSTPGSPLANSIITTNVGTPLNITTLQPAKTHVTQMLQQTIAQRVQLQQLNQQKLQVLHQQQGITQATSPQVITVNTSSLAGLNARPFTMRPMTAQLRPTVMALPGTIVAGTSILAASPGLGQASGTTTSLGNLTGQTTTPTHTTMAATTYKLATTPATATSASSTHSAQPINMGGQIVTLSAGNLVTTSAPAGQAVTIGTQGVTIGTQALTLATMKQIIAAPYTGLPTAQIVSPAQIQQLVAHQAAQQQAAHQAARARGPVPHIVTANAAGGQSGITSIPVMSPNMAVSPAGGLTVSPGGSLTVNQAGGLTVSPAGSLTVNQAGGLTLNQAGNLTVNQAGNLTMNQAGNLTMNQAGNLTMNQAGNLTMNQAGNLTMNQTGNLTMNQAGNLTMNQAGNLTMNQAGNLTVNQAGGLTMNQTGGLTVNQTGGLTMNQTGGLTMNQTGGLTVNQAGNLTMNQTGGLTMNQTGGLTMNQTGGLGVTQAQAQVYNTALSSQVLKSLGQFPVLQNQAFTLPIKPVFMVSMPNVVTTSTSSLATAPTTATVQVAMPTIPVSNSS